MSRPLRTSLLVLALAAIPCSVQAYTQSGFLIGAFTGPCLKNYDNAPIHQGYAAEDAARIGVYRDGGFNLLLNYDHGGGESQFMDVRHAPLTQDAMDINLATAASLGIKAFSCLGSPAHYVTGLPAASRAAHVGYVVGDEPSPSNYESTKDVIQYYHEQDPTRFGFLNLESMIGKTRAQYEAYLDVFVADQNPRRRVDVVSFDCYPFVDDTYGGMVSAYFTSLEVVRAKAGARPFWSVVASQNQLDHTWVSVDPAIAAAQFRFVTACPIAYGAKGLTYWWYTMTSWLANFGYRAVVDGCDGTSSPAYYPIIAPINKHILNVLGPVVMSSTSLGAFHKSISPTNEALSAASMLTPNRTPLVADVTNQDILVGVFRQNNPATTYYVYVVNKNLASVTTDVILKGNYSASITAAPRVIGYTGSTQYTTQTGTYSATTNRTTFNVSLDGGEGRLFRVTGVTWPHVAVAKSDFDGDGIADISYVTSSNVWNVDFAKNGFGSVDYSTTLNAGASAAVRPADYDGDGISDMATWDGWMWNVDYAANGFGSWDVQFSADVFRETCPVVNQVGPGMAADLDGDGKADMVVWTDDGKWLVNHASSPFSWGWDAVYDNNYGPSALGSPVVADYSGDGRADLATYWSDSHTWKIDYAAQGTNNGFFGWDVTAQGPLANGTPFGADYDGDERADLSVLGDQVPLQHILYARWSIDYASDGFGSWVVSPSLQSFIVPPAVWMFAGDYDGDGKSDPVYWRQSSGDWVIDKASNGFGTGDLSYSYPQSDARPAFAAAPASREDSAPLATHAPGAPRLDLAPNPISRSAQLSIVAAGSTGQVTMTIVDVHGHVVARPVPSGNDGKLRATWDLRDLRGDRQPAGVYFVMVRTAHGDLSRKVVVVD